jgi:hypothetical protein
MYSESLEINQRLQAQEAVGSTLHQLGRLSIQEGNLSAAETYLQEALGIFEGIGSPAVTEAREDLESLKAPAPRSSKKTARNAPAKKTAKKGSKSSKSSSAKAPKKSKAKKSSRGAKGGPRHPGGLRMGGRAGSKKGGSSKGRTRLGGKPASLGGRSRLRTK